MTSPTWEASANGASRAAAPTDQPAIGRLEHVPLREVWVHEALSLTPWLLRNADVLSNALGMELELREAEHPVGGFSLDLVGTDLGTGATVIVEDQLEGSDHAHLGQLLTYAGGTDPATIVWLAPRFRDEHRAALEWLNLHTDPGVRFFAVQISAVRIGDSIPAPLLDVVVRPNDWEKTVKSTTTARAANAWSWDTVVDSIRAAEGDAIADSIVSFIHVHEALGPMAGTTYGTGAAPSVNATVRVNGTVLRPWSIWLNGRRAQLSVNFAYLVSARGGPTEASLEQLFRRLRALPAVGPSLDQARNAGWQKRPSLPVAGLLDDPTGAAALAAAFTELYADVSSRATRGPE